MYKYIKVILDSALALIALLLLLPILLIIALLIKLDSKGSIFFVQNRVGINNKIFKIYKFRTMYSETPKDVPTSDFNDANKYITKIGNVLRKTSLDELPQLINILKMDMAIVGPRPALYNQYHLIELRKQNNVHLVRPGLTGLAQINGRDEISDEEKVKYDTEYVKDITLFKDFKIIVATFFKVLKKEGIVDGEKK
ncbi:MAG: sugar transferase [Erysipelotrichaceae bacterium]|nr:sugar transferase [Erysipelotrichaceae bacterium]